MEINDEQCNEILTEITNKLESLKYDLLKSTSIINSPPTISQVNHHPTLVEVNKRMQKNIVKPKSPK